MKIVRMEITTVDDDGLTECHYISERDIEKMKVAAKVAYELDELQRFVHEWSRFFK